MTRQVDEDSQPRRFGVVPVVDASASGQLKKAALLVDQIIPAYCTTRFAARRMRFPLQGSDAFRAELEWLADEKILRAPGEDTYGGSGFLDDVDSTKRLWIVKTPEGRSAVQFPDELDVEGALYLCNSLQNSWKDRSWGKYPEFYRDLAAEHRQPAVSYNNAQFIPVLTVPKNWKPSADAGNHALEVVVRNIPEPNDDTPWEVVIDWRRDSEAQVKLRRLRHWINQVGCDSSRTALDMEDELLCLMDDYRTYIELQRIRTKRGVLRTIVTTTAELAENVLKLKLGKLADAPFAIKDRHIDLTGADLQAPGREVAYLTEVHDRFGRK